MCDDYSMLYKLFLFFCLYLPFQIALNPAEGVDLASGRVLVVLLLLIWLINGLKNKKLLIPFKIQTLLIISFLFLSAFSLFWAENLDWGVRKLLFLLSVFPVYFVTAGLLPAVIPSERGESRDSVKIVKFLTWGAAIAGAVGIIQFFLQFIIGLDAAAKIWRNYVTPIFLGKAFTQAVLGYPSWLVNIGGHDYLRAFSTFPDPHMLSFYLGLALPLAFGVYYVFKRKIYLILSLTILFADLLTFSRGGYIGLVAGLIFVTLYFAINKKISAKKLLVPYVLILIILIPLASSPVGKRFYASFSANEGSNKVRYENWTQAVDIIKKNPLGVGIGNYSYQIEPSANYRKPIYAHNLYLDIAVETGIVNAIIFLFLLIFSIRSFIVRSKDNILYLGGAGSLVIFSVHSLFDTALYSVQVLPLVLIVIALSTAKEKYSDITHTSDWSQV
jgi:O-antigen ligase